MAFEVAAAGGVAELARHGLRLNVVALALVWLFSLLVAPG